MAYDFEHRLHAVTRDDRNVINIYQVDLNPTTVVYVSRSSSWHNSAFTIMPADFSLQSFLDATERAFENVTEQGAPNDRDTYYILKDTAGNVIADGFQRPLTIEELADINFPPEHIQKIQLSSPLGVYSYDIDKLTGVVFRDRPLQIRCAMAFLVEIIPVRLDPQEFSKYILTLDQPKPPRFQFDPPV